MTEVTPKEEHNNEHNLLLLNVNMENQETAAESVVSNDTKTGVDGGEGSGNDLQKVVDESGSKDTTTLEDTAKDGTTNDDTQLAPLALPCLGDLSISERTGEENDEDDTENGASKGYVTPIEDPLVKAHRYSAKHNILDLFQVS